MKLLFVSVGKGHDSYVREGIETFTKRISNYYPVEWKIISPAKQTANTLSTEVKRKEGESLLAMIQQDDYLVLLDETGKEMASPQLAKFIEARANSSVKQVVLLIGGAFGVDDQVKKRANYSWSLSQLVFPHQLVRLIVAEQVYRACTIIRNEKYHHE